MNIENIRTVVIVGAGIMGQGIALNFAQAEYSVRLVEKDNSILKKCLLQIDTDLSLFQKFCLLKDKESVIKSRIKGFPLENIAEATNNCDFVVEAIPELLQTKKDLFTILDTLPENVILSSNTSSFTITSLAEGLNNPERVIGLHYFNPAHIIPLVEIHWGRLTGDETIKVTAELMRRVGKKSILVRKEVPGFVVNRIQVAMQREVEYLISEGVVTTEDFDIAAKAGYGFRLANIGPLETDDLIGLDTCLRVGSHLRKVLCNTSEPSTALSEKVSKGELGLKSGKGWYDYTGKSMANIVEERNRKLLRQLALFNANE